MNREVSIKQLGQVAAGTFLVAIGIALLVSGSLGVDTISTFLLGIMNYVPVPFWLASMSFNVLVLLLVFFLDKRELGIGSVINAFGIGILLKYLAGPAAALAAATPYYAVIAAIVGPLFFGVGGGLYVSADLGAAALEALTNVLYKRIPWSIKVIRIGLDASLVVIGLLLGARIGLGTIMCVLLIGPVLELTLKLTASKKSNIKADLSDI